MPFEPTPFYSGKLRITLGERPGWGSAFETSFDVFSNFRLFVDMVVLKRNVGNFRTLENCPQQ